MTLTLHIDRLVLNESDQPLTVDRLTEAIRAELVERISAEGMPASLRSSFAQPSAPSVERTGFGGTGLGSAIYGSLS